ncbi:MAG: hypothetical protein DHS20C16_03670 [Phycisphaerae bacterium]|nr:MAG: hypothetical protein DHS20C16_03670 [Phycisphaerae bacterium]
MAIRLGKAEAARSHEFLVRTRGNFARGKDRLPSKEGCDQRCKHYRYSITFCAAAVTFLAFARNEFGADYTSSSVTTLRWALAIWGAAIVTGFFVVSLSIRQVWLFEAKACKPRWDRWGPWETWILNGVRWGHTLLVFAGIGVTGWLLHISLLTKT